MNNDLEVSYLNVIWVFSGKKIKRTLILITACLFALGIVYAESESIQTFFPLDKSPDAIYSVNTKTKQLALTFDISWGEERIGPILDVLEQKGVKNADFFISTSWAETHPDLVKRIATMGFEIGSNGHRHDNFSTYSEQQIKTQITKSDQILRKLTGKQANLIRYPNGDFDKRVLRIANQLGYKSILWDTDSGDWTNPGKDKIVKRVVEKAHPGDIVLMHASDTCQQTHEALPEIIDQLKAKGYSFATVSELITGAEVKVKSID